MDQTGDSFVVGRPARRAVRGRWWVAAGMAVVAVALAAVSILARLVVTPPAVPCPLPGVPGANLAISWASDSRSGVFSSPNNGVSLVRVPELTVKVLPKLTEFPAEVALPAGGRPFVVTIYNPRSPLSPGGRYRGAAVHYFLCRLSVDGTRWEQCLDNLFPIQISPDSRHVAATNRNMLRVWRLPDLSLESSKALPQGCAGRASSVYWPDNDELELIAPSAHWIFRLATGKLKRADWPMPTWQAAGFQVVRRGVPGESLRNWWDRQRGEEPVEDWELIAAPDGAAPEYVSLGRRFTQPWNGPEGPCLIQASTAVPAIPSPNGKYAFVPAADGTVRLWTRGQRAR